MKHYALYAKTDDGVLRAGDVFQVGGGPLRDFPAATATVGVIEIAEDLSAIVSPHEWQVVDGVLQRKPAV